MKQGKKIGFGKRAVSFMLALALATSYISMVALTEDAIGSARADSSQSTSGNTSGSGGGSGGGSSNSRPDKETPDEDFTEDLPIEELPEKEFPGEFPPKELPEEDLTLDSGKVLDSGVCICQYKCVILNPACPICAHDFLLCKGSTNIPRTPKIHTEKIDFCIGSKVVDTEHAYDPCWEHTPATASEDATVRLLGLCVDTTSSNAILFREATRLILQDGTRNDIFVNSNDRSNINGICALFAEQPLSIDGNGTLNISVGAQVPPPSDRPSRVIGIYLDHHDLTVGESDCPVIKINVRDKLSRTSLTSLIGIDIPEYALIWKNGKLSVDVDTEIHKVHSTALEIGQLRFKLGELYFTAAEQALGNCIVFTKPEDVIVLGDIRYCQPISDLVEPATFEYHTLRVNNDGFQVTASTAYLTNVKNISLGDDPDHLAYGGADTDHLTFPVTHNNVPAGRDEDYQIKWVSGPHKLARTDNLSQPNGLKADIYRVGGIAGPLELQVSAGTADAGTYYVQVIYVKDGRTYASNVQPVIVDKIAYPSGGYLNPYYISIFPNQSKAQNGVVAASQFFSQETEIPQDLKWTSVDRIDSESTARAIDTISIQMDGTLLYTCKLNIEYWSTAHETYGLKLESRNYTFDPEREAKLIFQIHPEIVNPLILEGVTVAGKTYDGAPVVKTGTLVTKSLDGNVIVLDNVTTKYQYVSMGNAGSSANSDTPPTSAGKYMLMIDVAGKKSGTNEEYAGRAEIPFTIAKAPLKVKADDFRVFRLDPLPTPQLTFTGFVNGENQAVLKAIYRGVHKAEDTSDTGSYDINVEVVGAETNANYAVTTEKGNLTVLETNLNLLSATPPAKLIDFPFVQAIPQPMVGMGTRYLFSQISNTSTGGAQMISKVITQAPPNSLENSLFAIYDIDVQKGSITDYKWESINFANDLEGGKMTLHLPIPANTNSKTYTYQIYHFPTGENGAVTPLTATTGNYSVHADATAANSFVLVATPVVDDSNYLSETPPDKLLEHPMVQGKSALDGLSIRYVYSNIANTSNVGVKMIDQLPDRDNENSLFALYDLKLEKGMAGGTWNPVKMATDLEGGSAIAHFPIPAGTNNVTYDYEIYHFPNGADKPPVKLTISPPGEYSLFATTTAFSPFAIVAKHKGEIESISQTPPTNPVTVPMIEGLSNLPLGMAIRYLHTDIGNTTTTGMQTISQLTTMQVSGSFYIYDIELQKSPISGSDWQPVNVATDLVGGKAIVHLAIPSGTSATTHSYTIYHFANGATKPPVALTTTATANSISAPTTSFSPFVLVATAKGGGGGGGGGSGGGGGGENPTAEYSFWQNINKQVERAKEGDVVKVNAKSYNRMPWNVMESLYKKKTVGMVITWNGGKSITIPAGTAQKRESGRVYWPFATLVKLYENIDEEIVLKPDPSNKSGSLPDEKVIPVTGGSLITVDAPETEVLYSNLTQPNPPTQEISPELSGFERESFPGVPSPDLADETSVAASEPAQRPSSILLFIGAAFIMLLAATVSITLLVKNYKRQKAFYQDL